MKIQHYGLYHDVIIFYNDHDWIKGWHGNYYMSKCIAPDTTMDWAVRDYDTIAKGWVPERMMEVDCLLSIMQQIQRTHATIIELGAGYGEWCLAFDGVIKNKLVEVIPNTCTCVAVEAEPTHLGWLWQNFIYNCIDGDAIHAVVSNTNGYRRFNTAANPNEEYGQQVSFNKWSKQSILGVYNLVMGKAIKVPSVTLDMLMDNIPHADLINIDVQGSEVDVLKGGMKHLTNGSVDYLQIGTHRTVAINKQIRKLMEPYFDIIVDLYPGSVAEVKGIGKVKCQDGIMVLERRGIHEALAQTHDKW